ncbi:hypothetical protein DXG01_016970 [Tephrocybe rancida]|nr:hypothetical protein DXG01_016970 [Tephrocybe rancida]
MSDEVKILQARLERREKTIATLRVKLAEKEVSVAEGALELVLSKVEKSNEKAGLPESIYDPTEGVDRCVDCCWEVVGGLCEVCRKEHKQVEDEDNPWDPKDSLHTAITYDSDREQAPRGDTPLPVMGRPTRPLSGYTHEQYTALLRRGATRLMIETFNLEFTYETGIFAWADPTLYAEFAGPKMREKDFWKIQLGRRFFLDDDDLDGSAFIEGLLEDAILYPGRGGTQWETVEPGIWLTRTVVRAIGGNHDEEGDIEEDEPDVDINLADTDDEEDEDEDEEDEEEDGEDIDSEENDPAEERLQDVLLQPFVDDGPILLRPGYDTSDDASDDEKMAVDAAKVEPYTDDVEMVEDTGAAIQAHIQDAPYEAEETDSDSEEAVEPAEVEVSVDHQTVVNSGGEDEGEDTATLDADSDSADSDFDEDEHMSGDEDVIKKQSTWWCV